jgi:hypothetical protein
MITYQAYEQVGEESYRVRVRLVDDVKGTFDQWFTASGSTAQQIRDDVSRQIAAMNTKKSVKSVLDGINVGTAIPVTAPVTSQTAAEIAQNLWFQRVSQYMRLKALENAGISTIPITADLATLKTQIESGYLSAYVSSL